jgi:L-glutamine-phosphate cytidylyltransferase
MIENLAVVLLVAGRGTRLGGDLPKCLTQLTPGGETILDHQLRGLAGLAARPVTAVVGHMRNLVKAAHPELDFVVNERYAETNTSKSLQGALGQIERCDVLWLNGDVVFDRGILPLLLQKDASCMAVNTAKCADEEIKYTTNGDGRIVRVSKQVRDGEGEAVGINLIKAGDLPLFKACLAECDDHDYFERGLELAIERGLRLHPVDIGDRPCIEIDFPEDLDRARRLFSL